MPGNQHDHKQTLVLLITFILFFVFLLPSVKADDIEAFIGSSVVSDSIAPPNTLFVLDRTSSMYRNNRIGGLKAAMTKILQSDNFQNVNAGIISYNGQKKTYILSMNLP